jgi:BirA family transcriptional regulator, biotin operon repressor / biotin---[acetyl-CoA-carboxylase] ligase
VQQAVDMAVYTDSPAYGRALLPPGAADPLTRIESVPAAVRPLLDEIFARGAELHGARLALPGWQHILAVEYALGSQYDRLVELARRTSIPDRVACVAGSGTGFHGFRDRAWSARPGNIHLTVHFAPERPIARFETVFTALAAVAVADAIDTVPELAGRARIKWVNDVLIDGAKVAGVLAYTQTRGDVITSAVLGIGVNVETTPPVARSAFVPAAASLRDVAQAPHSTDSATMLAALLHALHRRYSDVLDDGHQSIMEQYRARSALIGRDVTICDEGDDPSRVHAEGRVIAIGDGLELYLEGRAAPVTRGRLILGSPPRKDDT